MSNLSQMIPAVAKLSVSIAKTSTHVLPNLSAADVESQVITLLAAYEKSTVRHCDFTTNTSARCFGKGWLERRPCHSVQRASWLPGTPASQCAGNIALTGANRIGFMKRVKCPTGF